MVLTLATPTGGGDVTAAEIMTPLQRVASTPKGQLKSPYADFASVAEEGHRKYMAMPIAASTLYDFVQCPTRVGLDAFDDPTKRDPINPFVRLLWERRTPF
jgi:hypothetical protein